MDVGTTEIKLLSKTWECDWEWDRGHAARGFYPPEPETFSITRIRLVEDAFVGHDPIKIDLTGVFEDLGDTPFFEQAVRSILLQS